MQVQRERGVEEEMRLEGPPSPARKIKLIDAYSPERGSQATDEVPETAGGPVEFPGSPWECKQEEARRSQKPKAL